MRYSQRTSRKNCKLTFVFKTQIVEVKMKRQLSAPASIPPQKPMELLRNVVWLEGMPPEAVDFVTSAARIKRFDAGDTITRQGEELTGIYLIVSGMVKVSSIKHLSRTSAMANG